MALTLLRRTGLGLMAAALMALPALADEALERLARALQVDEVAEVLRREGLDYGHDLDADMLAGGGGAHFIDRIAAIYDTGRMNRVVRAKLGESMSAQEIADCLAYLDTPTGRRIMEFEVAARRAMSDGTVEQAAKEAYADAAARELPRIGLIDRFIEVNDLIDHNVAGALSSNYRFYSGLRDAGGKKMSEGQILDEVWQQEEDIRKETIVWMDAFLYMAYGPLTDAELQGYIDFSETAAGQALNRALFVGFDSLYDLIYYEIGQAVAAELQATDL